MKHLVIGHLGQVGSAALKVLSDLHGRLNVNGIDTAEKGSGEHLPWRSHDVLHVCVPGDGPRFVPTVQNYQRVISPILTIVYSSTPIGTCRLLNAVHSPIEGVHDESRATTIATALGTSPRPFGSDSLEQSRIVREIWPSVIEFPASRITEFLKLRSTTLYGLQIVFAEYAMNVIHELGGASDLCQTYDEWYNEVYAEDPTVHRPIITPPRGPIGGHCVVPNADLLQEAFPSPLIEIVAEFNSKQEENDETFLG